MTTEAGFNALEPAWTALYEAHGTSPFQSFAWQRAWWRHYGETNRAARLQILVVCEQGAGEQGPGGQRILGIAPFFTERLRAAGVVPVTRLALLGRVRSDYLDLLVAADQAQPVLDAFAAHLRQVRGRFDVLVMEALPEFSPTLTAWLGALGGHGMIATKVPDDQCPRVQFAGTWEATDAALPPATRGKMRRRIKHLATRHGAQLELAGDLPYLDRDLGDLINLHQRRWTAAGQEGVFANEQFAAFYRDAARELARRGQFVLAFLQIDGRRAVGISGFRHRDEFHFYHGGLGEDGEASRYSPGIALHLQYMERAHADGVRVYDLLRGTEPYKLELGGVPVPTWRVTVAGRPGGLGRWPYLLTQLQARAAVRIDHERQLLAGLREDPATGPREVRRHVAGRLRANVRDVAARLRHPW